MYLQENHISYTSCQSVAELIKPFAYFGVNFFVYVRVYPNGYRISLNNRFDWSKFFFDHIHQYVNGELFELEHSDKKNIFYQLWEPNKEGNQLLIDNEQKFGLGNGIDIALPGKEYTEFFVFATDKKNEKINNFYLNNLDILMQAIFYFKDKGRQLLQQAEKEGKIRFVTSNQSENHRELLDKESLLSKIQPSRYYLSGPYQNVYLTPSEYTCLKMFAELNSMQQIADKLGLSQRTVEVYINQIKEKINCRKKSDLMQVIKYITF